MPEEANAILADQAFEQSAEDATGAESAEEVTAVETADAADETTETAGDSADLSSEEDEAGEQSDDAGGVLDINSLPPEQQEIAKRISRQMERAFTPKLQEAAELRRRIAAAEPLLELLEEQGISDPAQVEQFVQAARGAAPAVPASAEVPGVPAVPQAAQGDSPSAHFLQRHDPAVDADPSVQLYLTEFYEAKTAMETAKQEYDMEAYQAAEAAAGRAYANLSMATSVAGQRQQAIVAAQQAEAQQVAADPAFAKYLSDPAEMRKLVAFQRAQRLPTLKAAAILRYHDRILSESVANAKAKARNTQTVARRPAPPTGRTAGAALEAPAVPPDIAKQGGMAVLRWRREHDPTLPDSLRTMT
jgi:hypothetical protein